MKRVLIQGYDIIPHKDGTYIAGIGRSNIELLTALQNIEGTGIDFNIYCTGKESIGFKCYNWDVNYHSFPFPNHISNYRTSLESWYRRYVVGYDLLHITNNVGNMKWDKDFVVTMHDMYRFDNSDWDRKHFKECGERSRGIVTCSTFSKNDIVDKLNVDPGKISVIPWGVSHTLFHPRTENDVESLKEKYKIKEQYFFACSCSNPRKNGDIIADATKKIHNNNVSVVLAWRNPPQYILDKCAKEIEERKLVFLDYLSDEELAILYSGAIASIFVSSFEGFGFPIVESMACGTPCITCKNSSLEEIGGDKAIYVKERDSDNLAEVLLSLINNGCNNDADLIAYADKFTWQNTAAEYVKFYKKYL